MVNGQFLFEDLPVLVLKSFGAVGLELGLEEREREVFIYLQKRCVAFIITQKRNLAVRLRESGY